MVTLYFLGAFFFDREGTDSLFRLEGVRLTSDEVENVYMSTEGWVSAIRLQIISLKENGSFDYTADIVQLVEIAIWNRLTNEEKDFLLSVSILDSFTTRQAAIMMGEEILPEKIEDLIKNNDFIRYIPDKHMYSIHSILQDYLRYLFHHYLPETYQNYLFHKAGQALAADGQFYPAAKFYFKVKDYEAILSLPFDQEYIDNNKEKYQIDFIEELINECPGDILCEHPFTMLLFAYQTLAFEKAEVFKKLDQLLCSVIQTETSFSKEELRAIHGEYLLMKSMYNFNNFQKMMDGQKESWGVLGRPSKIFQPDTPWIFATISALDVLWRESGELDNEMQCMDEMTPVFINLTGGNGAGAQSLFRAEVMLMRGQDEEAEILCHKALYMARSYKQIGICICAELLLISIAILRGDVEGYFTGVKNIQSYAKENSRLYILRMVEQSMSAISIGLGVNDYVVPWLHDMESIKKIVYSPVVPQAKVLYLYLLLKEKRYAEFYGASQHVLELVEVEKGEIRYLMAKVYCFTFLAIAKFNCGNSKEAGEYLEKAFDIALPDKLFLPFAQKELRPLLESARSSSKYKNIINTLFTLGRRQEKGINIIKKAILSDRSPLTPREREVAQLARDRLSSKEIASKLYISESTVKTILRNVYSKLDIHSRTELASKEF